jgi:cytochrome c553
MVTALAMTWFASAHAAETLELRSLAASCAACHGTDGHSEASPSLPSLAHLPQAYFLARMHAFRDDAALAASLMAQIAKGYDEQQLQQLADYFARQPKARY